MKEKWAKQRDLSYCLFLFLFQFLFKKKKKMVPEKSQQQISVLKNRFASQPAQTLLVVKMENASPEDLSEVFQQ